MAQHLTLPDSGEFAEENDREVVSDTQFMIPQTSPEADKLLLANACTVIIRSYCVYSHHVIVT